MTPLLLCSASPRRRELLASLGLELEVVPPGIDESRREGEPVRAFVERLAREKAMAGRKVAGRDGVALAADTIVVAGGEVLGKPRDRSDAKRMLRLLSGTSHEVMTGVCVLGSAPRVACVETRVWFRPLSEGQIAWLAGSGDGDDKAGAYAVQGLAGLFVERLEGSVTNVVGLPMSETVALLEAAGVRLPW